METRDVTLKSCTGTPVADNPHILASGARDPLLQDLWLTDKLARVDQEVTPERRMGAKGEEGTHGIYTTTHDKIFRFGRFCVLPRARQLLIDGQPVELGSRAFDLLLVLIGAPGTLIAKDEIISRVWPNRVVEESNLKMQMSALRRILNADRQVIKTVHGRGYVFTSKVTTASSEPDVLAQSDFEPSPSQLGPPLPTIVSNRRSTYRRSVTGSRVIAPDEKTQPVIVVIDDDPDRRDALREFLRAEGLCVEAFASMRELLDSSPASLASSGDPDKAASGFKKSWPRQSCAGRTSSAAMPMSPCRFGQ